MNYTRLTPQKFAFVVLKTALYSAIVNALLYLLLESIGVIHPTIYINDDPSRPITLVPVLISSVIPTLFGGLMYWLLLLYFQKGKTIFTLSVFVLGGLSFAAPFSLPQIPLGMAMALNLMHVVVMYNMLHYFRKATRLLSQPVPLSGV